MVCFVGLGVASNRRLVGLGRLGCAGACSGRSSSPLSIRRGMGSRSVRPVSVLFVGFGC